MRTDYSHLKRPRYPMPVFVQRALEERGLTAAYEERPAYQQNDYVGWISRAKRQETKESVTLLCLRTPEFGIGTQGE
jgi:hypothetical protein